jgi:hypothetical protein
LDVGRAPALQVAAAIVVNKMYCCVVTKLYHQDLTAARSSSRHAGSTALGGQR